MKGSRLTIKTTPPITVLTKGSNIEVADSQTFFSDDTIITVPESVDVELEHGQIVNDEFQAEAA